MPSTRSDPQLDGKPLRVGDLEFLKFHHFCRAIRDMGLLDSKYGMPDLIKLFNESAAEQELQEQEQEEKDDEEEDDEEKDGDDEQDMKMKMKRQQRW